MSITVADVINLTRESVLDDYDAQKYLWSDTELIWLLNRAYNELVKSALNIKDETTVAITRISLLANIGVYALDSRIIQVTDARLLTDGGTLVRTTEARLDKTSAEWRDDTGTPTEYCPGAYSGYLTIHPKFLTETDTLVMTVNRLATARFTTADITAKTVISDIRQDHIDGLADGIAKRAYLKPDTYTYYPQKAEYHKKEFEEFKKEVRRDMILLHKPDKTRVPRSGSSIWY